MKDENVTHIVVNSYFHCTYTPNIIIFKIKDLVV